MTLQALLIPRSIAIIGASAEPTRIGGIPVNLLIEAGFERIYPVNPKYHEIAARRCFSDIESVPDPVDLALLAVPVEQVLPSLERCHAVGVRAAIVFAAGYAETNKAEGIARQKSLAEFARRSGMRIGGPNCMGNVNLSERIFTTFGTSVRPNDPPGNTALLTQSGNMCATIYRTARRAGVAFSHIINTGNEADVEFADYLDFLAEDSATSVVLCYIEELRNGPAFLSAAAKFRAKGKLLAVYKVGATEKAAEAARSHTAALSGNAAAYDAAFLASDVMRAADLAGLSDLAYLHQFGVRIGGNACAILSISGAAGAILSDAIILNGGQVPTLPEDVQTALRARIPDFGMVSNPVDLTGNLVNAGDSLFDSIKYSLKPDAIDVLIIYLPGYFLDRALEQLERAAAEFDKALVVIDTFALADRARLARAGIALFDDFDRAARAIANYGAWKKRKTAPAPRSIERTSVSWPRFPENRSALSETEGKAALARFGVPIVTDTLVRTRAEARQAAERIGFPLVAKLVSADVAHKTEHGLVRLNLRTSDAVTDAFDLIMAKATTMGVGVEGVTLEPMLSGGVEILVGFTRDPVFDWMITIGLGGVWAELMKDVRHSLLPIDAAGAEAMLTELKGFALLNGYRGAPKADVGAAAQAIAALGTAVLAGGSRLREVEVNPLLVMPEGKGAVAVDAIVLLNATANHEEVVS
jgi:acetate---CoA ligase (ADP-forming)